ncbi:hypothetical protein [Actinomadura sp. DC4]|uniref:hypothetical protein n=1 Tax=Actinomadura sp. DC4 TaxID=3055069 RepID=UPI0025B0E67F|nr:hypothetical protein [Actinomadura sp. DC4]MDN3355805.1 hypothetical protein [Actinomadura sp. DC4]
MAPSATVQSPAEGGRVCVTGRTSSEGKSHGLVTVGGHPTAVVAVWLPSLEQSPCRTALTRGDASTARRLAKDVRKAPKPPSGTFNCPNDNGRGARLYFAHDGTADLVELRLAGCRGVSAPGRGTRTLTDRLARDLAPIAPSPWHDGLAH